MHLLVRNTKKNRSIASTDLRESFIEFRGLAYLRDGLASDMVKSKTSLWLAQPSYCVGSILPHTSGETPL